jgi:hypothetical protein
MQKSLRDTKSSMERRDPRTNSPFKGFVGLYIYGEERSKSGREVAEQRCGKQVAWLVDVCNF